MFNVMFSGHKSEITNFFTLSGKFVDGTGSTGIPSKRQCSRSNRLKAARLPASIRQVRQTGLGKIGRAHV